MQRNKPIVEIISFALFFAFGVLANAASAKPSEGILWEVKSTTNTIYLFGSMHIAKADFYPLPDAVEAAYQQADKLVVEVDITDPSATESAMPLLTYKVPDKLENHLSKSTWRELKALAGRSIEQLQPLRPATLASAFSIQLFSQQGYDAKYGIDLHFLQQAKTDHKKIAELESMQFQAAILGSLNDDDGDAMVSQVVRGLRDGTLQREANDMVDAWKAGDPDALATVLRQSSDKDAGSRRMMKMLFDDRNVAMAQKITQMLEAGDKAFVVVGAGHLAGANSVTDLLRKQGLQIRQIQ